MTQHGSFPDRPRGRRARHGSDSQWQSSSEGDDPRGPDGFTQDEREFPDLEPIRGRQLSDADNRGLPGRGSGRHGRHSAPDAGGVPGADIAPPTGPSAASWRGTGPSGAGAGRPSGFDSDPQHYGQYGQQPGAQRFDDQQVGGQYGARQAGGPPSRQAQQFAGQQFADQQQYGAQQAQPGPFGGQSYPGQPGGDESYPGQPGGGQREPGRRFRKERVAARVGAGDSGQPRSRVADDSDEITDDPMEAFSQRWARRGAEDEGGRRPPRLMWLIGGGGVIVVAIAVAAYFLFGPSRGSSSVGFGSLVTTFLPGEIQTVPDACNAVSSATISQYMPGGQPDIAAPPLNGGQDSQCTWTLDSPPTYRVIEADISAFSPSGLASGDGSATFAAEDAYASDLQTLKSPSAKSGQPKAVITDLTGLGDAAFSATQIFNVNGATTYKATVIVRYHNVIVTAVVNGLDHAVTKKGTYGPVSMSTLSAAASQVATQAIGHLKS